MSGTGITIDQSKHGVRRLTIDTRKFFTAVGKATVKIATGAYVDAAAEVPEMASALGLTSNTEDRAISLVLGGIERGLGSLVAPLMSDDRVNGVSIEAAKFTGLSEQFYLEIDAEFFREPWRSSAATSIAPEAQRWLEAVGFETAEAKNVVRRLPAVLARSLHDEWRSNPPYYGELLAHTNSPFVDAALFELAWERYRTHLIGLQSEQVFEEAFSLSQIYVEPRCFYFASAKAESDSTGFSASGLRSAEPLRLVTELSHEVEQWLAKPDKELTTRILAGGPGAGKSSYAKVLSSRLAQQGRNVLFVPLHQIDLESGISTSINRFFVEAGHFAKGPLDSIPDTGITILILDGLDELQMQGRAAQESAYNMVSDLLRWVDRVNSSKLRVKCLITGRELAVQSTDGLFRTEGQIIHLLPYYIGQEERSDLSDPEGLLAVDQRDQWWTNYGDLTGTPFTGMPSVLKTGEISEVTAQPLLNYLVALAYQRGLSLTEDTNVNEVYEDLLSAVYNRSWAKHSHPSIRDIQYDSFVRLLEEVALAVWHGAGRTTTLAEVEEHCRRSKVGPLLDALEVTTSAGVSSLLLSFYFRQKGRRSSGDKTFEFTHKTFAEYLASLAIVRQIDTITKQLHAFELDADLGIDDEAALHKWLIMCEAAAFDKYLNDFVRREVKSRGVGKAREWQGVLTRLLSHALRSGWPIHRIEGIKFGEQGRRVRNAEEALLACINACARVTHDLSRVRWESDNSFGSMVKRLQGQRSGPTNVLAMDCLSYMDLTEQRLDIADLYRADLSYSRLVRVEANYTIFCWANLAHCDLTDAALQGSNLSSAKLEGCVISTTQIFLLRSREGNQRLVHEEEDNRETRKQQKFVEIFKSLSRRGAILTDKRGEPLSAEGAGEFYKEYRDHYIPAGRRAAKAISEQIAE